MYRSNAEFLSFGKKALYYQSLFETMGLRNHDSHEEKVQVNYDIWLGKNLGKTLGN